MVTFWMIKINSYSARMLSEIVWPLMKADWTLSTKELIRLSLEAKMLYVDDFERSVDETNWEQVSNLISTILLRNEDTISLVDAFQVRIPWEEIVVGTEHIILGNVKVFLKKKESWKAMGPGALSAPKSKVALLISSIEKGASKELRSTWGLRWKRCIQLANNRKPLLDLKSRRK